MAKKTATAYFFFFFFPVFVCWFLSFFVFLPSQRANIDEEKLRSFGATKLRRGFLIYFLDKIDNHVE